MSRVQMTEERFNKGLTLGEFASGMKENQDKFTNNYYKAEIGPEVASRIAQIEGPINVVVIVEDWCGDVLRYVPVFQKLAEQTTWQVRVFYRDENPDLMDNWLKDGKHKAIPVIVFFDGDWNELGYYQEKPAPVYTEEAEAIAKFADIYPELNDASMPYAEMSQSTKDLYSPYMVGFRAERMLNWQKLFVDNVLNLAQGKGEKQPQLSRA